MSDRIITSAIATGKKLPMTAGRLDFLQNNIETLSASTIKGILGGYTTNDVIILYGCILTGSDPGARTMTAGAIFYNDITYQVDAASFITTGSNIPLWTKIETDSDYATYTDGSQGNVRATTKFVLTQGPAGGSGITGYIADYNASNVKKLKPDWITSTSTTGVSIVTPSGASGVALTRNYKDLGDDIEMDFNLNFTVSGTGSPAVLIPLPATPSSMQQYSSCAIDCSTQSKTIAGIIFTNSGATCQIESRESVTGAIAIYGRIRFKKA